MIQCIEKELLAGDFVQDIQLLQNYKVQSVDMILQRADVIRDDEYKRQANSSYLCMNIWIFWRIVISKIGKLLIDCLVY